MGRHGVSGEAGNGREEGRELGGLTIITYYSTYRRDPLQGWAVCPVGK